MGSARLRRLRLAARCAAAGDGRSLARRRLGLRACLHREPYGSRRSPAARYAGACSEGRRECSSMAGCELPGTCAEMAAAELRGGDGAGARHDGAAQRDRDGARAARDPALRPARRRQDHDRAHHRPLPQLREGPDGDAVRHLLFLPRDRGRPLDRRAGDRRGEPHVRGRRARGDRVDPLLRGARQAPHLRHRRSAHALGRGVQRVAQDARRAAAAQPLRVRHDQRREDPRDGDLALPAPRSAPAADRGGRRAARRSGEGRGRHDLAAQPAGDRAPGRGIAARLDHAARPGDRRLGQRSRRRARGGRPRSHRPARAARDRRGVRGRRSRRRARGLRTRRGAGHRGEAARRRT